MGVTRIYTVTVHVSADDDGGYRAVANLRGERDRVGRGVGSWHPHTEISTNSPRAGEDAATARALSDLAIRIATAADAELASRAQHPAGKGRLSSRASRWREP